jgi:hypothetical protein
MIGNADRAFDAVSAAITGVRPLAHRSNAASVEKLRELLTLPETKRCAKGLTPVNPADREIRQQGNAAQRIGR